MPEPGQKNFAAVRPSLWQHFAMRYRRFGKTGLSLPVLSCGGLRYQHK